MAKSSYCSTEYTGSKSGKMIKECIEDNNFLISLVDTIPAKMYFDTDIQEQITNEKHSTMDQVCEGLSMDLSSKTKHKRSRLDPLFQKKVSEINRELGNSLPKMPKKKGLLLPSASMTRAANIEELQQRLKEKIDEFHLKRQGLPGKSPKKKKLKNKEKKLKHKQAVIKAAKETEMQTKKVLPVKEKKTITQPKFNEEKKILFGKLDFSDDVGEMKDKTPGPGSKRAKDMLKKAEKNIQKIEELKNIDPEKAAKIEEKEKWAKAILKSSNVKVKDDPTLLKKSIKREEKIKQKKAKAWKERVEHTEDKMNRRQKRRTKNIEQKKTNILNKKLKRAKKKGRVIP